MCKETDGSNASALHTAFMVLLFVLPSVMRSRFKGSSLFLALISWKGMCTVWLLWISCPAWISQFLGAVEGETPLYSSKAGKMGKYSQKNSLWCDNFHVVFWVWIPWWVLSSIGHSTSPFSSFCSGAGKPESHPLHTSIPCRDGNGNRGSHRCCAPSL